MSVLLKKAACRAHSHKEPCPCKLEVDYESSGLGEWGSLDQSRQARQVLTAPLPTPLTPSFYLLSIEIGLGLDSADGGCRPIRLSSPLVQRTGCQEQGEEQQSPRGQHGRPATDSR